MLLKLTQILQDSERPLYVNPEHIATMFPTEDGTRMAVRGFKSNIQLVEPPTVILSMIDALYPPQPFIINDPGPVHLGNFSDAKRAVKPLGIE